MTEFVGWVAQATDRPVNIVTTIGLIFVALAGGSAVRLGWLLSPASATQPRRVRFLSLLTWWGLTVVLAAVVVAGRGAAVVVFAVVSLTGLWEFRTLVRGHPYALRHWTLVLLAVPVHYLIVYLGWYGPFWTFVPVWVFVVMTTRLVLTGETEGFVATAGITFVGLMLVVFLFSHAAMVLTLSEEANPAAGPWGLFLFLVVLTQGNDIAQALWGRLFGRRKIAPRVSPNKTWEGFLLGVATTVVLACLLAGLLTPFERWPVPTGLPVLDIPYLPAAAAGGVIAVSGFLGDLTMAAVKRDVGVKDSGDLLPGHGGILDRINSLTFAGPLFFYFTYVLYERPTP